MINFLFAVILSLNIYLPMVAAGGGAPATPPGEDVSTGDGTCLFYRSGNDVYLSIYRTSSQLLYVTTSSEREDEPYVISISPKTIQVGEVDANGESFTGITHEVGNWSNIQIRCDAQFLHQ